MKTALRASLEAARLLLAMAFLFFGYMKITLPMPELARHGAWVADLTPWMARAVGVVEIIDAIAISPLVSLRHATTVRAAALLLLANQAIAVGVHLWQGQPGALTLNAVWCGLDVWILAVYRVAMPPKTALVA